MNKNIFLFISFICIYFILLLLGNFEGDFSFHFNTLFFGNIIFSPVWSFSILGFSIFILGKKIIDENYTKNFYFKKISLFLFLSGLLVFFVDNFYIDFLSGNIKNILIILSVVFGGLYFYQEKKSLISDNFNISKKVFYALFVGIVLIGFSNIFINLGKLPFHQDEQYHFSPAKTYSETQKFAKWDFLNDTIGNPTWADRNKSLTIASSFSQDIFGLSEWSSRLPVAISGFLGMLLIFFVSSSITQNKEIGLISMYMYGINDAILYFSRFLRGYIFLILLGIVIFYLLFNFLSEVNNRKKLYYLLGSIFFFLIGFEFHATIILIFPLILICSFILINSYFSIKKHPFIYIGFFSIVLILILNILGIIHLFKTPYNIQNHILLNTNFADGKTIYLDHITNSFHLGYVLVFILPTIFFYNFRKNIKIYLLFFLGIFVPLFFSIYFFNRYEDFRYIVIIQGIFIIFVSYFIYTIWKLNSSHYSILFLIILLTTPIQIPFLKEIPPLTKKSIANWENIEGKRIHFRLAQPENKKAFDYLFQNFNDMNILRFQDGGINWDDNYYISTYLKNYPDKNFSYYANTNYYSDTFKEVYNTKMMSLRDEVSFYDLYNQNSHLILIGSVKHLLNKELLSFIEKNCRNISPDIGIIKHSVIIADGEDNYFPNVYICQKNKNYY